MIEHSAKLAELLQDERRGARLETKNCHTAIIGTTLLVQAVVQDN